MFSGGKYVLRKHTICTFQTYYSIHVTMTEIVEVADEIVNRTMAIAMFHHQRTPVVPLRTCHHVSPLYLGLYEVKQEAAHLPFQSGKVVFFFMVQALYPL
jgi:hypothetical protein